MTLAGMISLIDIMEINLKKFIALTLIFPSILFANGIDDKCPSFVINGAPVSSIKTDDQYICKKNYAIHYRFDTKTAEYVVEHPTVAAIQGGSKRKDDFRVDPAIEKKNQSTLADYATAGNIYDRGHLVPAGNNTQSDEIMSESFFLSNMIPQIANNNRGIWKQLETAVRNLAVAGQDVYVISGTIYDKDHKTIGDNKVGVPTKVWKVIINKTTGKSIGFIFPNEALPVKDLPKYAVTVKMVEAATGIDFSPKLPAGDKSEIAFPSAADWAGAM